ncbi:hypothetical protein TSMEX_003283 [Taenia solium]|eukprot:TsM_000187100 transcript=TsM_000187100 gene=TsM_000187100
MRVYLIILTVCLISCVECASSHSGHGSGSGSQHPSSGQHERHMVVAAMASSDSRHASPSHHDRFMAVV